MRPAARCSPSTSTAWSKDYIYLNGELLATESATQGSRYHFADHLGTPRVVTDAAGNVVSRHDYYPYGKEITPWSDGETHKFTGHERDAESGLDYFGARYYSANLSRFMSADRPFADQHRGDPQSWNLYAYARNNPLKYTDPDGEAIKLVTTLFKVAKAVYKGQDVYSTVKGVVDGTKVVFSGNVNVGTGQRLMAAAGVMGELTGATDVLKAVKRGATSLEVGSGAKSSLSNADLHRPYLRKGTRQDVDAAAPKTAEGVPIDPNTRMPIEGKPDVGHKPGHEHWREKQKAEEEGLSQADFNDRMNDSNKYQLEDPSSNRSRKHEKKGSGT